MGCRALCAGMRYGPGMHSIPLQQRRARRWLSVVLIGFVPAMGFIACSDDKAEHPPAASSESEGGESTADRVKRRANEAHSDFKEEVKPAAQWVDEKSRRVVDEVKTAVHKADDTLSDDDAPAAASTSKPAPIPPPTGAGSPPAAGKPATPPAASKPAAVPAPATPQ